MRSQPSISDHRLALRYVRSLLLLVGLGVGIGCADQPSVVDQPDLDLPAGISESEYRRAQSQFVEQNQREPERADIFALLGNQALAEQRFETALVSYHAIPTSHPTYGASTRLMEGQVLLKLHRASEAEQCLREFFSVVEQGNTTSVQDIITAYKSLAYLHSVQLRLEDRKPVLLAAHAGGLADILDSKQLYFPHLLLWHTANGRGRLEEFLEETPSDFQLQLANARYQTMQGELDSALPNLERLLAEHPDSREALAAILVCYYERNDWDSFSTLVDRFPEFDENEPWSLMHMRAEWAFHNEQWEDAQRYYEALLQADPAHPAAHMGMARVWKELGQEDKQREELNDAAVLAKLRVNMVNVDGQNAETAAEVAKACREIGYAEAAVAFDRHAKRISQTNSQQSTIDQPSTSPDR